MHAYYEKNCGRWRKTMKGFLALVRPELENAGGTAYDAVFEEIWNLYEREMLERFPYIGGDDVGDTKNLTEAYMLVAMGEWLRSRGATLEEAGRLMTVAYEQRMLRIPKLLRVLMGRLLTNPGVLNRLFPKKDARNAANAARNPGSFETKTQIPPEAGYDFSYHNLVCPLANFARQYGYEAYMPSCSASWACRSSGNTPAWRRTAAISS